MEKCPNCIGWGTINIWNKPCSKCKGTGIKMYKTIFEENGEWFFWDETWSEYHGPYKTDKEAANALEKYFEYLNNGNS